MWEQSCLITSLDEFLLRLILTKMNICLNCMLWDIKKRKKKPFLFPMYFSKAKIVQWLRPAEHFHVLHFGCMMSLCTKSVLGQGIERQQLSPSRQKTPTCG